VPEQLFRHGLGIEQTLDSEPVREREDRHRQVTGGHRERQSMLRGPAVERLGAETAFRPWLGLGAALLGRLRLDARLREIAILEVARLSGSRYEWVQHEAIATALGVGRDEVRAVEHGDVGPLDDDARAVVELTREVVHEVRAQDETLDALRLHLEPREIVELLLVIGHYMSIARIAATCGIEIDDPAQLAVVEAAAEHGDQA
jgi:4-carboxymuconolactone decarboxylase